MTSESTEMVYGRMPYIHQGWNIHILDHNRFAGGCSDPTQENSLRNLYPQQYMLPVSVTSV